MLFPDITHLLDGIKKMNVSSILKKLILSNTPSRLSQAKKLGLAAMSAARSKSVDGRWRWVMRQQDYKL
jgi:hypothetical protein